jgi:hypothetical protein
MTQVIHKLVAKNGKYIVLPPWVGGQEGVGNLAHPDVYVADSIQKYPIGTKFVDGDRVFHYGYAYEEDAAATKANIGIFCSVVSNESVTMDAVVHAAGSTELVIEDATATLNQYAGGYFMPRTNPYSCFRILSNTATSGGHVTLTLERGTLSALTASQGSNKLIANKYSRMGCSWAAGRDDVSWLGVTLLDWAVSKWQWIQTWGPCAVVPYNEEIGATAGARQAVFHIDGSARLYVANYQIMGYGIPHSGSTATWFINLQVDP